MDLARRGDNDLARFWQHLIAALQQIRPGVGEVSLSWFFAREAPQVETRLAMLINDLALADETFVLVMDDAHCVRSSVVHDSLAFFIDHLPPNVRLILTTRTNLPLPMARWRAGRRLVEFDHHDLRFSFVECDEFLQKVMGLQLIPEKIAALQGRTEGWVAGLHLFALALSTQITPSTAPPYLPLARLAQAHGDTRLTEAYLAQVVRLTERAGVPSYTELVRLCRAWLALQRGDLTSLKDWIQEQGMEPPVFWSTFIHPN